MIETLKFEKHGRRLLVEFRCYRCKATAIRSLEECMKEKKDPPRDLYDFTPPSEWRDGGFYYHLFCPKCKKAYEEFMTGEGKHE